MKQPTDPSSSTSPLRVLFESSAFADTQKTGVGYFASQLIEEMSKLTDPSVEPHYLWLNFLGRKIPHGLLDAAAAQGRLDQITWMPQRVYAKLIYAGLRLPLTRRQYDWSFFPNFYLWPVPGARRHAVIIHDLCFLRHPDYVEEKNLDFLRRVALPSIKRADLIVVNSQFTQSELVELMDVPIEKICAIDVPVDPARFDPALDTGIVSLGRYGVTKPYLLHFGTLEPRKNLESLVEAYVKLPDAIRATYSLLLAGKIGWRFDDTMRKIENYRRQGYDILVPGYISHEDTSAVYRNASLYLIPSHYEGFGMPILEALYCGLPTISSKAPALVEVGKDAAYWSDSDADSLAASILTLLGDESLCSDLSQKAIDRSRTYSWHTTAQKLAMKMHEISRDIS